MRREAMLRSAAIHRSGWADMFVRRELDYVPGGGDRIFMLVIKALGSFMGSLAVAIGALAPVVIKSERFNATDYGHFVGGVGILAAFVALTAAHISDKFNRVRILLWGMILPIVFHFLMAFMPDGHRTLFMVYYLFLGLTETWAIVTVSALLRDFSPRTGRALGVGLVTIGSQSALWLSFWLTGHLLNRVGTWQHMFLIYGFITLACWRLWMLAAGQGLFLIGYSTFVAFGPVFTVAAFHKTPQDASNLTSYLF